MASQVTALEAVLEAALDDREEARCMSLSPDVMADAERLGYWNSRLELLTRRVVELQAASRAPRKAA